jgi:hypothetical protein
MPSKCIIWTFLYIVLLCTSMYMEVVELTMSLICAWLLREWKPIYLHSPHHHVFPIASTGLDLRRPLCNTGLSDTKPTHKFCNFPADANCSCIYQIQENATEFSRLTLSEQEYMQDRMMITCVVFLVAGTYFLCCPLMTENLTCVTFDKARFNSGHQLQFFSHNIWPLSEFI